jgi:hypothetical protein
MNFLSVTLLACSAGLSVAAPHWAFEPLGNSVPPDPGNGESVVDRFMFSKFAAAGQVRPASADKRTLLRRLTFDLTGLPPSVEEMNAFLADAAPQAFDNVVEHLLASPAYGEKWGRAWLDVVRYADTAGETADIPLPHAWRYRNWVIKAFNEDLRGDEFIRWQIAGDLLAADGPPEQAADKTVATGFLAISRRFGFDIEKDIHLTFEDTIDTMGKAFLGLSFGCARCHDHKYDPVSNRDYYGLYGILQSTRFPFTGCEKTPRSRDMAVIPSPQNQLARKAWEAETAAADAAVNSQEAAITALAAEFSASPPALIAEGALAPGAATQWPQDEAAGSIGVTQGETLQLTILPKSNFGGDATGLSWLISELEGGKRQWNLTEAFLTDPAKPQGDWSVLDMEFEPRQCVQYDAEFEKTSGLSAWRGVELWPSLLINTRGEATAYQTVTLPPRSVALHPGPRGGISVAWTSPVAGRVMISLNIAEIDPGGDGVAWKLERRPSLAAALEKQRPVMEAHLAAVKQKRAVAAREPQPDLALAVADLTPVNARIQKKGEPKDPGEEVPRKLPDFLGGALIPAHAGSGRREVADWLTRGAARDLTARVMVNRIWQGHFGEGIVSTPNDFGTRGAPPSNLGLLDFLAAEFIRSGWSFKAMHRLLLTSAAWQRADFPRRRLTAEELRDTLLLLGGNLDRTSGGPHPFPPESAWGFTQHNPFKAVYDHNRRSIYLMVQRTQRHPFLALFDAGDPNASTPVRSQSTVPTQALYFLNDPFVHTQAKAMATRLVKAAPEDAARMELAARELYGRPATEAERTLMTSFLETTGASIPSLSEPERTIEKWAAWLRVLFGTNELLYVD